MWLRILLALAHDLFVIYFIGLVVGFVVGLFKWGNTKQTFFEAVAPAFVWPLAVIKESFKYLRK